MAKVKTTQKAKVTAAEKKPKSGVEIGRSGTNIFKGIIVEEYLPELSGARAMRVYDEMRKSDATVKAALSAISLPIRQATWFVSPGSEDKKDIEIAEYVEKCLFQYQSMTWDDTLRQALLSDAYGVMVFEKVFETREEGGQVWITWKKFAPRMPKSITAWELADGSLGIKQTTTEGGSVEIPMDKLLVFNSDKEGDNWWGISKLRPAYKHWYIKTNLEKIDAIAHERQGLGVPFVELPKNASEEDRLQAQTILENLRAHEKGYLIQPAGMAVEFKDMKANSTKDASRAIDYHNRSITLAVLAQYLMLGSGASGSFALSQNHSELLLTSLEATANMVKDVFNKYAIQQLVDLNFDGVENYPTLDFAGISKEDVKALSVSFQQLVQSGFLKPTPADEAHVRKMIGLPERTEEDDMEEKDEKKEKEEDVEEIKEDLGLPEDADKKKVENSEVQRAVNKRLSVFTDDAREINYLERMIKRTARHTDERPALSVVHRVLCFKLSEIKRKKFQEENNFKSWRKLTFAEKKVNFESIQEYINNNEATFIEETSVVLKTSTEQFLDRLNRALSAGDTDKIKDLELSGYNEYRDKIKTFIRRAFDFGKTNAARELDVKTPANPSEINKQIDLYADTIATQHHYSIETEAKLAVTNQMQKFGEKEIKALGAAAAIINSTAQSLLRDTAAIVIADALNKGRDLIFTTNKEKIYAFQRSEILDETTCNFCLSMDGRIVDPKDDIVKSSIFHSNCRGIWVEIMNDEEELPKIKGIPDSIRDRVGESVNELVQPKKPIVKKDSLASQMLDKKK